MPPMICEERESHNFDLRNEKMSWEEQHFSSKQKDKLHFKCNKRHNKRIPN